MANRIISIEVGYSLTKVCEMDFRAKNPKVYKYFTIPTPEGVYEDGFLTENPEFITTLRQAIGFNKMRTKQAVCSVTSSKIATREVMLPSVKASQVQALVEANAGDYFPINLNDYELGHLVIGNIKETDGTNKLKVLVMACHKQLIQGYEKLCDQLGLHLISLDYSGNSIYQIMKNEIKDETEMVLRVEEKQSIATIISGQNMMMQRNVVYGVENAMFALMGSTAFPQKTYEEAYEELKRIRCIRLVINDSTKVVEKDDDEPQVTEKVAKAMKDITDSLAPLIGNIARVLDLYNSKNPDKPVTKISLIGMGSDISGLSKLFTNELGVKTIVCNNIRGINWNHAAGEGSSGKYVSTIGAGLAPVGFVNEEKKKNDLKDVNYKNVAFLVAILTATICGALYFLAFTELAAAKVTNLALKNDEAKYAPSEELFHKYEKVKAFHDEVLIDDNLTYSENDNLIAFLDSLEKALPEEAKVKEFTSSPSECTLAVEFETIDSAIGFVQAVRDFDCTLDVVVNSIAAEPKEQIEAEDEGSEESSEEADADNSENSEGSEEEEEEQIVYTVSLSIVYFDAIYYSAIENQ